MKKEREIFVKYGTNVELCNGEIKHYIDSDYAYLSGFEQPYDYDRMIETISADTGIDVNNIFLNYVDGEYFTTNNPIIYKGDALVRELENVLKNSKKVVDKQE